MCLLCLLFSPLMIVDKERPKRKVAASFCGDIGIVLIAKAWQISRAFFSYLPLLQLRS